MYSLAIKNGVIVDGTGGPSYKANLYVSGDKIAEITGADLPAEQVADAAGHAVAPGFIDIHSHSDNGPWTQPGFEGRLHQGVTTDIAGNCGSSWLPRRSNVKTKYPVFSIEDAVKDLETRRFGANFNTFIGHGTLRTCCMSDRYARIPSDAELEAMKELLDRQLAAGAAGMSIGLEYMPGYYCATDELVELAKVVKKHGKLCSIHMRDEGEHIREAMEEVHTIAKRSGVHMHISHLKIMFSDEWGHADEILSLLDSFRKDGCDVSADQYPYLATSTTFQVMMPDWARTGTGAEITAGLVNDETWQRMSADVKARMDGRGGPSAVFAANTYGKAVWANGKNLAQLGEIMNLSPLDAFRSLMITCNSSISGVFHAMNREDTLKIMAREDISVISDSTSKDFVTGDRDGVPHPRSTSSAVKFLRTVREKELMSLEKAVYKLTGLPAAVVNLPGRGVIKAGNYADIVIFDPETVADRGTYEEPFRTAAGIDSVYVNGVCAWKDGAPAGLAGRFVANSGR